MGTHIECFFPHAVVRSIDSVHARLDATFARLGDDLLTIRERGRFSNQDARWSFWESDDEGISGEGACGFDIDVFRAVVLFTSLERFSAIQLGEQGISAALRRVLEAVAGAFDASGHLAVAGGGFGDTDGACELAMHGAGFAEICRCLEAAIGPPARSWEALEADLGDWYLSDSVTF